MASEGLHLPSRKPKTIFRVSLPIPRKEWSCRRTAMAGRQFSSTLKNLKFMQKTAPKEVKKAKEVEEKLESDGSFGSSVAVNRKCVVIMEGNPHPGVLKGRMSFQSFNPSIDKLNQEAAESFKPPTFVSNTQNQNGEASDRPAYRETQFPTCRSEDSNTTSPHNISDVDLKRKRPAMDTDTPAMHYKSGMLSPDNNRGGSSKQRKREKKLDWNVLRRTKVESERD